MDTELVLEIVTPFGKIFNGEIVSCTIPGTDGQFQILKDHAALISTVDIGSVKIEYPDLKSNYLTVAGGFCEVKDNSIELIAESAEFAHEIDVARAEAAKKRAEERLSSKNADIDIGRAKVALLRSLSRLKLSQLK